MTLAKTSRIIPRYVKCGVSDCEGNAHYSSSGARGYCGRHRYRLLKHGHPEGGRTQPGVPEQYLNGTVKTYRKDDCLVWPYARNSAGYGHLIVNGRDTLVHRIACEAKHGPAPTPKHHAAHSCGKGHEGCCNPQHLRWATPRENLSDKNVHGTLNFGESHGASKLTDDQVNEIRASDDGRQVLAKRYGVDPANINAIRDRKTWRHLP